MESPWMYEFFANMENVKENFLYNSYKKNEEK